MYRAEVKFGGWIAIADAAAQAPDAAGVMQARGNELIEYPSGRSAMVLYGHSGADSLRAWVTEAGDAELRRAAAAGATWIRFAGTADPAATCARLLHDFAERFGSLPYANASTGDPRS